jgi:hypothetical protein
VVLRSERSGGEGLAPAGAPARRNRRGLGKNAVGDEKISVGVDFKNDGFPGYKGGPVSVADPSMNPNSRTNLKTDQQPRI